MEVKESGYPQHLVEDEEWLLLHFGAGCRGVLVELEGIVAAVMRSIRK